MLLAAETYCWLVQCVCPSPSHSLFLTFASLVQKAEKSGKVVPLGGRGDNSDTASTNVSHSGSSKHVVNNSPRGQSQTGDGDCKEGVGRQRGRQSSLFLAAVYGIAERGGEKKNALREDERELSFAGSIGGMLRGDSEKAALNELVKNCGVQMYIQASVEDENLVSGIMTFAVSQTMGEVLHYASEHGFGKNLQEVEVFNKRHRYIKATSKDDRKEFVLDQVMQVWRAKRVLRAERRMRRDAMNKRPARNRASQVAG